MTEAQQLPAMSTEELDHLGHSVIALAKELWVLHDRQRVLEARLGELGLDLQLETYVPPPTLAALLEAEREAFVQNLVDTLTGRKPSPDAVER